VYARRSEGMSLKAFTALYAAVGAAAALLGWAVAEWLGVRRGLVWGYFGEAATCGLVGAAVGAGLSLADGLAGAGWSGRTGRAVAGLLGGGLAAAVGTSLGPAFPGRASIGLMIGWALLGAGVGGAEGLFERSRRALARDAAAGAVGALVGGLPFGLVYGFLSPLWEAGARAFGFLLVGACAGAALGLVRVVLAEAWLTVVEGHKVGRRIFVRSPDLHLGRSAKAALSFSGSGDERVDLRHARVVRRTDEGFVLEDLHSRHGTWINANRVVSPTLLFDGDLIRLGGNAVRFNLRSKPAVAKPPVVIRASAPAQAVPRRPTPPAPAPASPKPVGAAEPPAPQSRPCPQCGRPVFGPRPHCMICDLSF
jgi:FHA domain